MPTLDDWITKYEQEAEKLIILPGFSCYYEPDKGFFYWHVWQNVFEVDHTCINDYKWLLDKLIKMAKVRGCTLLRTATKHDPAAFMRLFKGTPNITLSGIRPNGVFYWVIERKVI
jgi:hypothetical protein